MNASGLIGYNKKMKIGMTDSLIRFALCAGLLLLAGCNGSDDDSLIGEWTVSFTGTHTGTAAMFIDSDGAFDFNITLTSAARETVALRVKGIVNTNGRDIVGKLFNGTEEVGLFQGYMHSTSSCDGNWAIGSGIDVPRGDWTGQKR